MNLGVGAAAAVGGVVGLFAGSLAGKAMGGKPGELIGAGLGGVALGAFFAAALTAPTAVTTTTPPGTGALPRGLGPNVPTPLPPSGRLPENAAFYRVDNAHEHARELAPESHAQMKGRPAPPAFATGTAAYRGHENAHRVPVPTHVPAPGRVV